MRVDVVTTSGDVAQALGFNIMAQAPAAASCIRHAQPRTTPAAITWWMTRPTAGRRIVMKPEPLSACIEAARSPMRRLC